jgi:hypothetical protein
MNLFRSEEHIARWLAGRPAGMTTSVETLNELAKAWWGNRLDADWSPRSREASQAILDSLGLTGPLWQLA